MKLNPNAASFKPRSVTPHFPATSNFVETEPKVADPVIPLESFPPLKKPSVPMQPIRKWQWPSAPTAIDTPVSLNKREDNIIEDAGELGKILTGFDNVVANSKTEQELNRVETLPVVPVQKRQTKPLSMEEELKAQEKKRMELYIKFERSLDYTAPELINDPSFALNEALFLQNMEEYKLLFGAYPYVRSLLCSAAGFALYLQDGIQPEMYEDVRGMVQMCIEENMAAQWETLKQALSKCKVFDGKTPHPTEIYLHTVGSARILAEAHNLTPFRDHRLAHALVTIQRWWRFRAQHPLKYKNGPIAPTDLARLKRRRLRLFEQTEHDMTPVPKYYLHLHNPSQITEPLDCDNMSRGGVDEELEDAIMKWNRRMLPKMLRDWSLTRSWGCPSQFEFYYGVENMCPGFFLAMREKQEAILTRNREYLLDDDALTKIVNHLFRCYYEGRLKKWRDPKRDVLKFLSFRLNEAPPKFVGKQLIKDIPIATCYLEKLNTMPFHVLDEILRWVPKCLFTYGEDLCRRLEQLNVLGMTVLELRQWFLDMVIDDLEDVIRAAGITDITVKKFEHFLHMPAESLQLKAKESRFMQQCIGLLRKHVQEVQNSIRGKQPIYRYQIWTEPVKMGHTNMIQTVVHNF